MNEWESPGLGLSLEGLGLRKTVSLAQNHGLGLAWAGLSGLSVKNIINSSTVAMRQCNIIKLFKISINPYPPCLPGLTKYHPKPE